MKNGLLQRMLTGWTVVRILYLLMGGLIIAQSVSDAQWVGFFIGGYFLSMGLFNYGCAAGACYTNRGNVGPRPGNEPEYTEIK